MTVSRNQFTLHDKTMLIGSSDSEPAGKLRVSLHHNVWKVPSTVKVSKLLSGRTGAIAGSGNLVNGTTTDLVAAYNATSSKDLKTSVNWTPTLTSGLEWSAAAVKNLPMSLATTTGAGVLS